MKYVKSICVILILACFLLPVDGYSADRWEVQVIYFKPTDASPAPVERIKSLMRDTQEYYAEQMETNGHGNKTFKVESVNNEMVIHEVQGRHKAEHYYVNTYEAMNPELPQAFANANRFARDEIYVFIVGGLDLVYGGVLGVGWPYSGWRAGGVAVLPGDRLNMPIIAHEIGHAFGLFHNDVAFTMMGLHHGPILDYETKWISKSHYFNDRHIRTDIPQFLADLDTQSVGAHIVKFRFMAQSNSGLHQSKIIRARGGYLVVGTDDLDGKKDIAEIEVPRRKLLKGDTLSYRIIDIHGNYVYKDYSNIDIPKYIPDQNKTKPNDKNPVLETDEDRDEIPEPEPEPEPEIKKDVGACPGCVPDGNEELAVSYNNKLTISWAKLKSR